MCPLPARSAGSDALLAVTVLPVQAGAALVTAVLFFVGFGGKFLPFNKYFAWANRPARLAGRRHL